MRIIIFVWIAFVVGSCQPIFKQPPKPQNLLDENILVEIIIETLLLQEKVFSLNNQYSEHTNTIYKTLEKEIFAKYQTDSITYYQSYDYYSKDIEHFEKIYNRVCDSLIIRRERIFSTNK
ncbi:MAG: DUF4296 domain-containing protein [Cytophagales bacterium]|nr:DUF4296 domain-containing protein [Cytophagales bacterium]MDW8384706.1 DUF4296 domain-containing protein [Flammeovirgaceae bacterium]